MSNYSEDKNTCRVDFFKPSGKWYTTLAIKFRGKDWKGEGGITPHEALKNALSDANVGLEEMTAICLEPYHEYSHPLHIIWEPKND